MVPALQRGSLTAATASQKACTPWLWSRPCLQTASLSYLLRCCTPRTRGSWPDRNEDRRPDLFTCEQHQAPLTRVTRAKTHAVFSECFPIFPVLSSMYVMYVCIHPYFSLNITGCLEETLFVNMLCSQVKMLLFVKCTMLWLMKRTDVSLYSLMWKYSFENRLSLFI